MMYVARGMPYAICSIRCAACGMPFGICSKRYAARGMPYRLCNMGHGMISLEQMAEDR